MMTPKKVIIPKKGPEAILQADIVKKLRELRWIVKETHGNLFQWGFPDIYAAHRDYGSRWIEVKDASRRGDIFTAAQHEFFHELASVRVGVWVLVNDSDYEFKKLHGPANWHTYLQYFR